MSLTSHTLKAAASYIESWLGFQYKQRQLGAMGVLIRWQGKTVLRRFYGTAAASQLFPIASNSKMFTSAAIMQLRESGKLKLDDALVSHLPWLSAHNDKRWRNVTVQHLLNHSAGLSRDGTLADYWNDGVTAPSHDQLKADILREPLFFAPGETFKYSNYGYGLLGLLIEALSGHKYEDYIRLNILRKLSLNSTQFDDAAVSARLKGMGILKAGRRSTVPVLKMRAITPAGGILSTLDDVARFGEELVWGERLISSASQKLMRQKRVSTNQSIRPWYGLGFEEVLCGKKLYMGHGGAALGFSSRTLFDASRQLSVVLYMGAHNEPALGVGRGIVSALDFFDRHGAPSREIGRYNGRFENLWGITDIVAAGDGLYSVDPESVLPLENANKFQYKNKRYHIAGENKFSSIGQPIDFTFRQGKLAEVSWAGSRMHRMVED